MTVEKLFSYYWGKHNVQKICRFAENSFKAIHERVIRNRLVRGRRVVSNTSKDTEDIQRVHDGRFKGRN